MKVKCFLDIQREKENFRAKKRFVIKKKKANAAGEAFKSAQSLEKKNLSISLRVGRQGRFHYTKKLIINKHLYHLFSPVTRLSFLEIVRSSIS